MGTCTSKRRVITHDIRTNLTKNVLKTTPENNCKSTAYQHQLSFEQTLTTSWVSSPPSPLLNQPLRNLPIRAAPSVKDIVYHDKIDYLNTNPYLQYFHTSYQRISLDQKESEHYWYNEYRPLNLNNNNNNINYNNNNDNNRVLFRQREMSSIPIPKTGTTNRTRLPVYQPTSTSLAQQPNLVTHRSSQIPIVPTSTTPVSAQTTPSSSILQSNASKIYPTTNNNNITSTNLNRNGTPTSSATSASIIANTHTDSKSMSNGITTNNSEFKRPAPPTTFHSRFGFKSPNVATSALNTNSSSRSVSPISTASSSSTTSGIKPKELKNGQIQSKTIPSNNKLEITRPTKSSSSKHIAQSYSPYSKQTNSNEKLTNNRTEPPSSNSRTTLKSNRDLVNNKQIPPQPPSSLTSTTAANFTRSSRTPSRIVHETNVPSVLSPRTPSKTNMARGISPKPVRPVQTQIQQQQDVSSLKDKVKEQKRKDFFSKPPGLPKQTPVNGVHSQRLLVTNNNEHVDTIDTNTNFQSLTLDENDHNQIIASNSGDVNKNLTSQLTMKPVLITTQNSHQCNEPKLANAESQQSFIPRGKSSDSAYASLHNSISSTQQQSQTPNVAAPLTLTFVKPRTNSNVISPQSNRDRHISALSLDSSSAVSDLLNNDILEDDNCSLKSDDLMCDFDDTLTMDSSQVSTKNDRINSFSLTDQRQHENKQLVKGTSTPTPNTLHNKLYDYSIASNLLPSSSISNNSSSSFVQHKSVIDDRKDKRASTSVFYSPKDNRDGSLLESLDELTRLNGSHKIMTRSVSLKPPSSLPPLEDAEQIPMDIESYRQVMKDVTVVKTILHQLDRLLKQNDVDVNPLMSDSMINSLYGGDLQSSTISNSKRTLNDVRLSSSTDDTNILYDDLLKEIVTLRKEKEQDKNTIRLLQEQMYKYSSSRHNSKLTDNSTQTDF